MLPCVHDMFLTCNHMSLLGPSISTVQFNVHAVAFQGLLRLYSNKETDL